MKSKHSFSQLLMTFIIVATATFPNSIIAAEEHADGTAQIILNNLNCSEENKFVLLEHGYPDKVLVTARGKYPFKVAANQRANTAQYFYSVKVCKDNKPCAAGPDRDTKFLEAHVGDKLSIVCENGTDGDCKCSSS